MDTQIRRLGLALLVLLVLLLVQINYLQVYAASRIAANPANGRTLLSAFNVQRGAILAADERTVMARSVPATGLYKYRRVYPYGKLYGQITGFQSLIYGTTGLEAAFNSYLSGTAPELATQTLIDQFLGRPKRGASIVTTIVPRLQRVAAKALGSEPGAVVAIDPSTGAIEAMVANPSFDPTPLASQDGATERRAWHRLNANPSQPLLSRASQQLYPPGSTFKLVTTAAALMNGMTPATRFPNPPVLKLPDTTHTLSNFGGEHCLGGIPTLSMTQAFTVSCNVVYGEIGLRLGADRLVAQARRFGFDGAVPFDLPFAEGRIPPASAFVNNRPLVAISAIGQASVTANPLQMALVASAVADHGIEMQPRIVSQIRDASGRVVKTFGPQVYGQPITPAVASEMTAMMVSVVRSGTGTAAQIPGVEVAGKTGTAQNGTGKPHAWFVCFAPAQQPKLVVAVIVLNGGSMGSDATGGAIAAPIAKAVLEAGLRG